MILFGSPRFLTGKTFGDSLVQDVTFVEAIFIQKKGLDVTQSVTLPFELSCIDITSYTGILDCHVILDWKSNSRDDYQHFLLAFGQIQHVFSPCNKVITFSVKVALCCLHCFSLCK